MTDEENRTRRFISSQLPTDVEKRLELAIVAAIALLPDPERDAWRARCADWREAPAGALTDVRATLRHDGWLEFVVEGLPPLRIHEKAVGGIASITDFATWETTAE